MYEQRGERNERPDRGDRGERGERGGDKNGFRRRRGCRFCQSTEVKVEYKDVQQMRYYISERGKIVPRRMSGNCAKHQRAMAVAIKRARQLALIPFTVTNA